ncbi:membrane protein [Rhizocola hellebori]|uniref:Membrane protein n=1 Tax=Rhizocola hellebori TaxID=1392758 RepID=A0A8J3QD02_9ACTN|nr:UbiA family prenyltransferase [Rhizocola hellebori]GIH08385.1 membrane protein [Rhizocola hellebori]
MIIELLRACHPVPTAAVTALSGLLAVGLGQPPGTAALAAATIGLSQLSIGWANDAIDAPRDRAVGRADKPLVRRTDLVRTVKNAAWIAGALTLLAGFAWGWPRGALVVVGLIGAQLYNWPLKATVASIVPYLICFAALPAFLAPDVPLWLIAAAALLGGGAHLINAIPDLEADRVTGIRGLPQRLGARPSLLLASLLLLVTTVVIIAGASPPAWASVLGLLASAALPAVGWFAPPRVTFRAVIVVAGIDVGLLLLSGAL